VQRVARRFDVVVSTNAGYPLDRNLYQAVKGMAAAERVAAPGGRIVMACACEDGVPAGSAFDRILREAGDAKELLDVDVPPSLDYWQAQVLARVGLTAQVEMFSDGLTAGEIAAAHLIPIDDISESVARAGRGAVCVLPEGPLTVATAR
jgi:nickel-dependent lactate racemase